MSEDIAQSGPEMILEANIVSEPRRPLLKAEKMDFWNQPEKTCSEGQLVLQRMCSRQQNLPPMCTTQQKSHTRARSWKKVLLGRDVKPEELVLDRPHMMVKKRMSSNDLVFRFEIPGSPRTAGTAPNSPRAPLSPADSPNSVFLSSEAENGVEEKKKLSRSPTIQSPTLSSEAESPDQRKIICLRSKSTSSENACLVREKNDCKTEDKNDSKMDRKKSSSSSSQYKANMHFHKLFPDVPTEEPLQQSFTCALQKEILYQGKLFISENWICFHSKVFGKDTKIAVPTFSVTQLKKTKTALLVPNALVITTLTDRYIFVSLLSRDSTYKLIKSVCSHLENTSVANSPNPSSLENSFRADRPSSLPLDFNDEFSDLDGVVRQRRKHMEGYSSSGSQTPESENSRDFLVAESQAALNVSKGEVKPARVDAHVNRVPEGKAKSLPAHGQPETTGILHKAKPQKCLSLHHILIFYAVVVCVLIISTFYMRYRINTLEDRLGSLTTNVDTHPTEQTAPSGLGSQVQLNVEVLCQELTANIMKLEKIQNNLQKLLENGD